MPPTKLFVSQLRLLSPLSSMSMSSSLRPFPSRTFFSSYSHFPFPFKFKYLALRTRAFSSSTRSELARSKTRRRDNNNPRPSSSSSFNSSKSLVDDEAELSDWVDELRTARVDDDTFSGEFRTQKRGGSSGGGGGGRPSRDRVDSFGRKRSSGGGGGGSRPSLQSRDRVDSFGRKQSSGGGGGGSRPSLQSRDRVDSFSRNPRFGRRFNRGLESDDDGEEEKEEEEEELRSRKKRKGGELRRGGTETSARRRRFELSDDDEVVEKGKGLKGFLSEDDDDDDDDDDFVSDEDEMERKSRSAMFGGTQHQQKQQASSPRASSPSSSDSYLSETRFDQCSISPLSLKGVKDAGYEKMTVVQEATLPLILKGKDVLAKAKTGTGKTVAFLLPSIEVVANSPPTDRDHRRPPIFVLVICPTRELASQAATEATKLLKYHPTIGVQVVIGGTRLALEQKRMQANPCQILVATPGRLRDHIENTSGFATRLMGVKVLVLDEADHLLDMGFRKDIEKIIAAVPKQRQTLLFSATVPEEVRQICHIALRRDHEFISTVQEGSEETHSQVRQMHLVAPLDKHFSLLYALLKEHIADDVDYKVLVFCTTAMVTKLVAEILGELNLNVREIHSRKPQSYRTRVSEEFRKSKGLILVTSDVSARGVDYPDVTLVIQVGLPADREQYIHRLGRTGRRGKEGQGILLLAPWEEFFLSTVKDLPIEKAPVPSVDPDTKKKVEKALCHVEMKSKEAAYQAWLGYYNSNKKVGRDKYGLVELANEFSRCMGLDNPPAIPKLILGKMGLKNIPGLRSK